MKIDRRLNLVFDVKRDDGSELHVFTAGLSGPVVRAYYLIMAKVYGRIAEERLHPVAGGATTRYMIEDIAKATARGDDSWWEGPDGVEAGLLGEIHRLSSVFTPDPDGKGWAQLQLAEALKRSLLSEEELADLEGANLFFTLQWRMLRAPIKEAMINSIGAMYGWQISSSTVSDLRRSLSPSTVTETSEVKPKPDPEALSEIR